MDNVDFVKDLISATCDTLIELLLLEDADAEDQDFDWHCGLHYAIDCIQKFKAQADETDMD